MEMISGLVAKVATETGITTGRIHLGVRPRRRTIQRLCRRGMETPSSLMTESLTFSRIQEVRTRVILDFLFPD